MAITSTETANIQKLLAGMFNEAANSSIFNFVVGLYEANGNDLSALATKLATYSYFNPGADDAAKVATLMTNLGLSTGTTAGDAANTYFTNNIATMGAEGLAAAAVTYLSSDSVSSVFADAAATLTNKATVAQYYTDSAATAVVSSLSAVDSTDDSVTTANSAIDAAAVTEGTTFELTDDALTGVDADTIVGTTGRDTITSTDGTLDADDIIIDTTSTDFDTLNATMESANGAATIQGIETINVSWDSFGAATFVATNVTGATINVDTTKSIHTAGVTVTGLGANTVDMGSSVMTGEIDADSVTTGTIKAGAMTTVTSDDATITNVTVVANSATTIELDGDATDAATIAANIANVTVGTDTTLDSDDIANVNLTASAAAEVTMANDGTNTITDLDIAGASNVTILAAEELAGETITDSTTAGTVIASLDSGTTIDASNFANTVVVKANATTLTTIDVATGVTVDLAKNVVAAVVKGDTTTATTNTATITAATTQTKTTLLNVATATVEVDASDAAVEMGTFETGTANTTFNVDGATNATTSDAVSDLEFTTVLTATDTDVMFTGTGDVEALEAVADLIDASGLTGELLLTEVANTTTDVVVNGSSGVNDVTFDTTTGDATFVGLDGDTTLDASALAGTSAAEANFTATTGAGDDTITADVTTPATHYANIDVTTGAGDDSLTVATASSRVTVTVDMGAGDDVVDANALTTSSVEGDFGAGDDELSLDEFTAGVISVTMGEGNDTVDIGNDSIITSAVIEVDLGNGDDTITLNDVGDLVADVNIIITGGTTGTDTLALSTSSIAAANLVLTNIDAITIADGVDTTFSSAQLSGKSYEMSSVGGADTATIDIANTVATTTDLSLLDINNVSGTAIVDVTVQASDLGDTITGTDAVATTDTITGGDLNDTINGMKGDDVLDGADGQDTLTGGAGADSFVIAADTDDLTEMDIITDFTAQSDDIDWGTTVVEYTNDEATDYSAHATLAEAIAAVWTSDAIDGTGVDAASFTYGGKIYLTADAVAGGTFTVGTDLLVDITGYTGTILATDIA